MKTLKYFMCATLALATVALVGCKKDDDTTKKGEIEKKRQCQNQKRQQMVRV